MEKLVDKGSLYWLLLVTQLTMHALKEICVTRHNDIQHSYTKRNVKLVQHKKTILPQKETTFILLSILGFSHQTYASCNSLRLLI